MKPVWLAFVMLAACEKDHGVHLPQATNPHVGERDTVTYRMEGHFTAPDGAQHTGHFERALSLETLAVNGIRVTRLRITLDRDVGEIDGVQRPALAGTFELTDTGELTKSDGSEPTPQERKFFGTWHIGVDPTTLLAHEFREGEVYRPSQTERTALSLPETEAPIELHVTHATADEVAMHASFDETVRPDSPRRHTELTTRCLRGTRTSVEDVTLTVDGRSVGTEHAEIETRVLQ